MLLAALSSPNQPTLREAAARHRVLIGTAVEPGFLREPGYARILGAEFSALEPENKMKFDQIHPQPDRYDFAGPDELVHFAKEHNMKVRGHTLVWHNQQPRWVTDGSLGPERLATVLHDHIDTVMGRYKGIVFAWDVVNEAFNDNGSMRHTVWYDKPGIGFAGQGAKYIEQALTWARKADPRAELFYNDYDADTVCPKSDAIYAMAKEFKRRKAPLDGVGFQMHVDLSFDRPESLESFRANLSRFAALGLKIHITELDVRLDDNRPDLLAAQAKAYQDIVRICVAQPKCKLIQLWGLTDRHSWIPSFHRGQGRALLWDANDQKKPAYDGFFNGLLEH